MVKVAEWTDEGGFSPVAAKYTRLKPAAHIERNRTYIVTTIVVSSHTILLIRALMSHSHQQEEPYIMIRKEEPGELLMGNDRFEGYCKDLADLIAKRLNINCKYKHFHKSLK